MRANFRLSMIAVYTSGLDLQTNRILANTKFDRIGQINHDKITFVVLKERKNIHFTSCMQHYHAKLIRINSMVRH